MKDYYTEETEMKETEESTPKMEISHAHELEERMFLNVHTIQSNYRLSSCICMAESLCCSPETTKSAISQHKCFWC